MGDKVWPQTLASQAPLAIVADFVQICCECRLDDVDWRSIVARDSKTIKLHGRSIEDISANP